MDHQEQIKTILGLTRPEHVKTVEHLNSVLLDWQERPYTLQMFPKPVSCRLIQDGTWTYEKNPERPDDCLMKYFGADTEMYKKWHSIIFEHYPDKAAKAIAGLPHHQSDCIIDFDKQPACRLLCLPAEVRKNIWKEVLTGNIIHVSEDPQYWPNPNLRPKIPSRNRKYLYHTCVAFEGFRSSACPSGEREHKHCHTSRKSKTSSFHAIKAVCKHIYHELPYSIDVMFTDNALQFADLRTAEEFLFSLPEYLRAKIEHLRLAMPYDMLMDRWAKPRSRARMQWEEYGEPPDFKGNKRRTSVDEYDRDDYSYFEAISNYYSVPWDRKSLGLYCDLSPKFTDNPALIKKRVFFRYAPRRRFSKDGQELVVEQELSAKTTRSLRVPTSTLIWKGMPRLDITVEVPVSGEIPSGWLGFYGHDFEEKQGREIDFFTGHFFFDSTAMSKALKSPEFFTHVEESGFGPLLQFKDYDGLNLQFNDRYGGLLRTDASDTFRVLMRDALKTSPTEISLKDFYSEEQTQGKRKTPWLGTPDSNYRKSRGKSNKVATTGPSEGLEELKTTDCFDTSDDYSDPVWETAKLISSVIIDQRKLNDAINDSPFKITMEDIFVPPPGMTEDGTGHQNMWRIDFAKEKGSIDGRIPKMIRGQRES